MTMFAASVPHLAGRLNSPSLVAASARASAVAQTRNVSSSPYGRTHVWKHRQRQLPKPFVPQFPQRVIRADGSTFTHYTTSPRSVIRLTRDTTNNPLWNASKWMAESEEEDVVTGRLGRFNRRFDGLGGHGQDVDWMSEATGEELAKAVEEAEKKLGE
ncbi:uncharacterized protein FIBRA_08867 [Fibroporia radiculosa]|uniref:50S ribosomal protein L36 n=1 Tax=Fibroporia radiculosa TaxID=599839 RepID=J4H5E3_9APHY|nr:uncharacterized protein FIBRA_08867 [Fibroporia radiculosa]CCM06589.1 predicted protein [Fibroporia radiculosa]